MKQQKEETVVAAAVVPVEDEPEVRFNDIENVIASQNTFIVNRTSVIY